MRFLLAAALVLALPVYTAAHAALVCEDGVDIAFCIAWEHCSALPFSDELWPPPPEDPDAIDPCPPLRDIEAE